MVKKLHALDDCKKKKNFFPNNIQKGNISNRKRTLKIKCLAAKHVFAVRKSPIIPKTLTKHGVQMIYNDKYIIIIIQLNN